MRESGATATDPLAREQSNGAFLRQESRFRGWVTDDGSTEFPAQADRYHLYVARACPWAHRTIIARMLMGLEDAIGISFVDPIREDDTGWA
ncbi:MAG: glutathione S-transferase family protein, partial [Solirubrobacteraceae bacterium]